MYFGCYGNLKFPLTCNGENENWHLLLSRCTYFREKRKQQKSLLSGPLPNIFCPNPTTLFVAMATESLNFLKIFFLKNQLLRSYKGDKAEFLEMFIALASTKTVFSLLMLMHFGCYGNLKFP